MPFILLQSYSYSSIQKLYLEIGFELTRAFTPIGVRIERFLPYYATTGTCLTSGQGDTIPPDIIRALNCGLFKVPWPLWIYIVGLCTIKFDCPS